MPMTGTEPRTRTAEDSTAAWRRPRGPIHVGISSCLLGEEVRFDGGHKRDSFLVDVLGRYVEWAPTCPEIEVGMGVPRPPIQLFQAALPVDKLRLIESKGGIDHSAKMQRFSKKKIPELQALELCGYVLKEGSPSCGLRRVKIHRENGPPLRSGTGLFAQALSKAYPDLPIEEEGRLCNPQIRSNFIERLFAYQRLQAFFAGTWEPCDLVTFHAAHELQLRAHSEKGCRELRRLVGEARDYSRRELRLDYSRLFMRAIARPATLRRHTKVLRHALGHLRKRLPPAALDDLAHAIEDFQCNAPPIALIASCARMCELEKLRSQTYLEPHPVELLLRTYD